MTIPTLQFLQDVCAFGPKYFMADTVSGKLPFPNLQMLEQQVQRYQHVDLYFLPAAFRTDGDRDDTGAVLRRAFVLDIDVRPNKDPAQHFHTTPDAIAVVDALVARNYVPPYSYMVDSGGGLHVYWLGPEDYNQADWRQINDGFLHRLDTAGDKRLVSDRTTSRRFSGLFRMPESLNYKHGAPRPCRILAGSGARVDQSWIDLWVSQSGNLQSMGGGSGSGGRRFQPSAVVSGQLPAHVTGAPMKQRMAIKEDPVQVDPIPMLNGCALLNRVIANPAGYNEPAYIDVARCLSSAVGGRQIFHNLAKLDPARYSASWADWKFDHAQNGFSAPPNCHNLRQSIAGGDNSACLTCPMYRADKPRSLHSAFEKRAEPAKVELMVTTQVGDEYQLDFRGPSHAVPAYLDHTNPDNEFFVNPANNRLTAIIGRDDNNVPKLAEIHRHPFWFTKIWSEKNPHSYNGMGEDKKIVVAHMTELGQVDSALVSPEAAVSAPRFCDEASKERLYIGKDVVNLRLLGRYLSLSMEKLQGQPDYRSFTHKKLGWTDYEDNTGFLLGHDLFIGNRQVIESRCHSHAENVTRSWQLGRKGSYQKQLDAVMTYADPFIPPAVRLALLLGLGSPLLSMLSDSTTMILLTGGTGAGKTGTMATVNSMYGKPVKTLLSEADTKRGMASAVGGANHLFCYFDEITMVEPEDFRRVLMDTAASGPRNANNQDGTPRMDDETSATFLMASANKTIQEYMPGISPTDLAAKARCFQLEMPVLDVEGTDWTKRFQDMQDTLKENYGWMGAVFIDFIVTHRRRVKDMIQAHFQAEQARHKTTAARFQSRVLAVARTTEDIMKELGWMAPSTSWTDSKTVQGLLRGATDKDPTDTAGANAQPIQLGRHLEMDTFLSDMVNQNPQAFPVVTDGVVAPIPENSMRRFAGIRYIDTKTYQTPVEVITVADSFLQDWCDKQDAPMDTLLGEWSKDPNRKPQRVDRWEPSKVLNSTKVRDGGRAWQMPPIVTSIPT